MTTEPNITSLRVVLDSRPSDELDDQEVVAYMVRLVRSGSIQNIKRFMEQARSMFPDMPQERINKCAVDTAPHFGKDS